MKVQKNQVRIISGKWRGRKISFPESDGLRPTTDRIRETVFNWLMRRLPGAICLDLFAGSGALGFEAVSRGAGQVDMVENNQAVFTSLSENKQQLDAANIRLHFQDALSYLNNTQRTFDILFLDPPFRSNVLTGVFHLLSEKHCLRPGGLVYLELAIDRRISELTGGWEILKEKRAGNVHYLLLSAPQD